MNEGVPASSTHELMMESANAAPKNEISLLQMLNLAKCQEEKRKMAMNLLLFRLMTRSSCFSTLQSSTRHTIDVKWH